MPATFRWETRTIPTYPLGPADDNPPLGQHGWRVYPYAILDDFSAESRPMDYRMGVLSNEYLDVTVCPALGGRIFDIHDKRIGRPVLHRASAVKYQPVALRKAWICGGLEFNFPNGHTVDTVSRVEAREECSDGRATIWVGAVDRIFQMRWEVGISLRDRVAAVDLTIRLTNPTDLPHPFYFWENAGIAGREDLSFIYATAWGSVDGELGPWPIREGKAMNYWRDHPEIYHFFGRKPWGEFFAGHYQDDDYSVIHASEGKVSPGMKIFAWGTSDQGRRWDTLLGDPGDPPLTEMQTGPFEDQSIHRMFPPHSSLSWRSCWYGAPGLGGLTWASPKLAMHIRPADGGMLEITATSPEHLPRATLEIIDAGGRTSREQVDLSPESAARLRVRIAKQDQVEGTPVTFHLLDDRGEEVAVYEHVHHQPPAGESTERRDEMLTGRDDPQSLCIRAMRLREDRRDQEARDCYEQALAAQNDFVPALTALAVLDMERHDCAAATEKLTKALAVDRADGGSAYYLGICHLEAGALDLAEDLFWDARRHPEWTGPASSALGRVAMFRQRWRQAARRFIEAAAARATCPRLDLWAAVCLRKAGDTQAAAQRLERFAASAPTDRLVWWERALSAAQRQASLPETGRALDAELDPDLPAAEPERIVLDSIAYQQMALPAEAASILRTALASEHMKNHPLLWYHLAFLFRQAGQDDEADQALTRAAAGPIRGIFPNLHETRLALDAALEAQPDDAKAKYLLGTYLYATGRTEPGAALWREAAEAPDDFPTVFRNLAVHLRQERRDRAQAAEYLAKATAADPDDFHLWRERDRALARIGRTEDREAALAEAPESVRQHERIRARRAHLAVCAGEYDQALTLLTETRFPHNGENSTEMHDLHLHAFCGRGIARLRDGDIDAALDDFRAALVFPENLSVGRPHGPDNPLVLCLIARARELAGLTDQAAATFGEACASFHRRRRFLPWTALAAFRSGRDDLQRQAMRQLEQSRGIRVKGDERPYFVHKGHQALGRGQMQAAVVGLKEAVEQYPQDDLLRLDLIAAEMF